jgi:thiol-disulfide isomerase/thioredoxin
VVTKERFEQGLTLAEYIDQMAVNRDRFVEALEETELEPEDAGVLVRLGAVRRLLVITEDWCGTCLSHVPFVAKLVEARPGIEMRFFPRDANLDLMDQYLKKGRYRSIPVFAFFDDQMNEVARFLECRPA